MPDDQLDTTDDAAQNDQGDQTDTDQVDTDQADQDKKPFSPEQEQHIGSWLGRIVAKQIDDKVLPALQPKTPQPNQEPNVFNKFDEQLQEDIFSGKVYSAIDKALNVREQTKQNLSKSKQIETDRALTALSDKPFYKDTFGEAQKIAHEAVQAGYPPEAAVELGYNKAKASFLERKLAGGDENLNLSEGGRPPSRTKTPKLPPEFSKACKRDIAKGLFKNEKEYIDALSPSIRAKYGI